MNVAASGNTWTDNGEVDAQVAVGNFEFGKAPQVAVAMLSRCGLRVATGMVPLLR